METLRFLMISTHYPPFHLGGDAVFVQYLSEELVKAGHEVHVFYNPSISRILNRAAQHVDTKSMDAMPVRHVSHCQTGKLGLAINLSFNLSGGVKKELSDLINGLHPDVIHWHNTKGFIGRPFGVPGKVNLYTAHDYYLICPRSNLLKPDGSLCSNPKMCLSCTLRRRKPAQLWRAGARRRLLPAGDIGIICPSEYMAARFMKDGFTVRATIRNFVPDPGGPHEPGELANTITYVGVMEPHKGPQTLLEAFANSRQEQGFRLNLIGGGSQLKHLRDRAQQLGISNRVSIPGFSPRDKLISELRSSAALVIPSEWPENAPLIAIEALSLGIPIIGSSCGGIPEIVGPDSGSLLFRAGDVSDLSKSIVSIWNSRTDAVDRTRKARLSYELRFSPQVHMRHYQRVIEDAKRSRAD